MTTVTITVGGSSNKTLDPLPVDRMRDLIDRVRGVLSNATCSVFVDAAVSRGEWVDRTTGQLVHELSCTWVADAPDAEQVTRALPMLAAEFEQDAIACTVGETVLIGGTG